MPIDYTHQHFSTSIVRSDSPHEPISPTGGGGTGVVVVESTTLTAAEILDLHNTPVEITSTPAAGKIIWPFSILFRYHHVTTNYTNAGDTRIYVSTIDEQVNQSNGGYWATSENQLALLIAFNFDTMVVGTFVDDLSVLGGTAHALAAFTGGVTQQFTGGDGTLAITTAYMLIDA